MEEKQENINDQLQEIDSDEVAEQIVIHVDPNQKPLRIDKFLSEKVQRLTRSKIQNGLRAGSVTVDHQQVKSNYKIRPREVIRIVVPKVHQWDREVTPTEIPLDIVYEDDDILVVNKQPGLVVHPGIGHYRDTLVNGLAHYFQRSNLPVKEGNTSDRMGLVHRIDKDTSGLLVVAKNEYAMSHLGNQFFHHTIGREYLALIWGEPAEDKGTLHSYLARHETNRMQFASYEDPERGKEAITHYEVVKRMYYVSIIKCHLETGRTHQIRVHMRSTNNPIFNDARYEGDRIMKGTVFSKYKQFVENCFKLCPRQCLHAQSIEFVHPGTEEKMRFEVPIPDDMQSVMDKWEAYVQHQKVKISTTK